MTATIKNRSSANLAARLAARFLVIAFAFPAGDGAFAGSPINGTRAPATIFVRAARGDANAQAQLGFMYEYGRGVPQDYQLAVRWYLSAAVQGQPNAQFELGLLYDKGHGVPASSTVAYKWLNLAAAHAPPHLREYYLRIRDAVSGKLSAAQVDEGQWMSSNFVPQR
jgi:TPR repeat protein